VSPAREFVPRLRLTKLLQAPDGMTVAEVMARAKENLETLHASSEAELWAMLERCEARFAELGHGYDDWAGSEIYVVAVRAVGGGSVCGRPGVDAALTSLCDLLQNILESGRSGHDAVRVHLAAWRMLMSPGLPGAGAEAILEGLRTVSALYVKKAKQAAAK
jgi:hypothetical protein